MRRWAGQVTSVSGTAGGALFTLHLQLSSTYSLAKGPTKMPATVSSIIGPGMGELFHIGDTVLFTVTFSEAVTVTGEPYLQLSNGAKAIYESISPDLTTLTFSYLVAEGDDTLDLEVEANQLFLNAGSITNVTLAPADLAIVPGTDVAGVASIDATRPTLDISAQHVGNQVTLFFTFSEAVQGFD